MGLEPPVLHEVIFLLTQDKTLTTGHFPPPLAECVPYLVDFHFPYLPNLSVSALFVIRWIFGRPKLLTNSFVVVNS